MVVSVGYAAVWYRLCSYMVSVGCAVIWWQSVVQLYGVSRLCSYMVVVITLSPPPSTPTSAFKTPEENLSGEGGNSQQITSNCQQVLNWLKTNTCIS